MKYKVGDKVIIAGENSVCTITDVEPNKVNYPYRLENCRGEYNGWWDECDLHSAENLIDPEEATEQVTKDLESGVYDAPIGITPEMMGVTDAVVKGREYNKGYDDGVSDTEKNMKMQSCKGCYFCQYSLSTRHRWKCKLRPKRRFNISWLHGWFCKERCCNI